MIYTFKLFQNLPYLLQKQHIHLYKSIFYKNIKVFKININHQNKTFSYHNTHTLCSKNMIKK